MSIYTKTGDDGTTSLFGGKRVLKSDPLVEAYGTIDELTSFIGLVANKLKKKDKNKPFLISVQKDLYQIMSVLAGDREIKTGLSGRVKFFEQKIGVLSKKLPPLARFILPGGTETSSWFHILRTVCRRAERNIVRLKNENPLREASCKLKIVFYLNRLSDLFFVLARYYGNRKEDVIK